MKWSNKKVLNVPANFWFKVLKTETCWYWTGYCKPNGYGQFAVAREPIYAHRMAWILTNGEIPDGLHVLHRCDIRPCVRPLHLFLGTAKDNLDDAIAKKRVKRKLTPDQIRQIRADTKTVSRILAVKFKVSKPLIDSIRRFGIYNHELYRKTLEE